MPFVANDTALADTLAEARALARQRGVWLQLVAVGAVIGLAGPFGTYTDLAALPRIAYWVAVVVTTFWIGYPTSFLTASWLEDRGIGAVPSLGAGALVASLPLCLWLAALHGLTFGAPVLAEALRLWPYVAAVTVLAAALSESVEARNAGRSASPAPAPRNASDPPDNTDRAARWLDAHLPGTPAQALTLLHAQDHYLSARTDRGEVLIRANLRDATDALGVLGLRVHRSWWVARTAIRGSAYRHGALCIVLRDGTPVPVGRTYRRDVRAALGPKGPAAE